MSTAMKIGMVGLDTSHCSAFSLILNDKAHENHIPGAELIAAFPGGSNLFSLSRDRVKGYTDELTTKYNIKLYDSISGLAQNVDAIFLESVDGRQHLDQFEQLAIGKPVYIDKPFAVTAADAKAIIRIADKTRTPIMSSSSLRYAAGIADLVDKNETIISCEAFGPAALLEDYPGLFWYGIHSAEVLFKFMGAGCKSVQCIDKKSVDVVIGEWHDGRIGIFKGTRFEKGDFGCVVHTNQGTKCGLAKHTPPYYFMMLQQVIGFFKSGKPPIPLKETYEIIAFLEAADASRKANGSAIEIAPFEI
ncbi:gfo/Idh/MocA family oxidoreductase [candidate division KSB1 bacterium]|nr:gfo/Idh/MocA family oxidoreductase [candidate division KSB1 bacterium]